MSNPGNKQKKHKRQVPKCPPAKLAPAALPIATAVRRVWVVAPLHKGTHLKETVQNKTSGWGNWVLLVGDGEASGATTKSHLHACALVVVSILTKFPENGQVCTRVRCAIACAKNFCVHCYTCMRHSCAG